MTILHTIEEWERNKPNKARFDHVFFEDNGRGVTRVEGVIHIKVDIPGVIFADFGDASVYWDEIGVCRDQEGRIKHHLQDYDIHFSEISSHK